MHEHRHLSSATCRLGRRGRSMAAAPSAQASGTPMRQSSTKLRYPLAWKAFIAAKVRKLGPAAQDTFTVVECKCVPGQQTSNFSMVIRLPPANANIIDGTDGACPSPSRSRMFVAPPRSASAHNSSKPWICGPTCTSAPRCRTRRA